LKGDSGPQHRFLAQAQQTCPTPEPQAHAGANNARLGEATLQHPGLRAGICSRSRLLSIAWAVAAAAAPSANNGRLLRQGRPAHAGIRVEIVMVCAATSGVTCHKNPGPGSQFLGSGGQTKTLFKWQTAGCRPIDLCQPAPCAPFELTSRKRFAVGWSGLAQLPRHHPFRIEPLLRGRDPARTAGEGVGPLGMRELKRLSAERRISRETRQSGERGSPPGGSVDPGKSGPRLATRRHKPQQV